MTLEQHALCLGKGEGRVDLFSSAKPLWRRTRVALKTRNVLVPTSGRREVELGRGVVRDRTVGATFGRPTDAAAGLDVRIAVEFLAVRGKSGCILVVGRRQVGACVHGVDVVGAVACGVGTGADEDLAMGEYRGTIAGETNLHHRAHAFGEARLPQGGPLQGPASG